ncbi:sensor histidine kinase [Hymenobacter bucti]|uniref:histidine kinase n=1 Tax=Hymenobacter bucti TaxID=1844114 RepID=A0ABW4QW91_9BACT
MQLRPFWRWLGFEALPSEEVKRRTTAIEMGIFMATGGLVYALVYAALGFASLPLMALLYVASFGLNLLGLHLTGRFGLYERVQLASALLFPLAGHVQLGGFQNSSMLVLAVFLAPAAALLFNSVAVARRYFYAAAVTLILAGIWDYCYAPDERLPRLVLAVFAVLSPLFTFTILYFLMESFRRKQEQLRAELQQSLDHLQATQAQLVQREKMASLGELTAGIAHEIQNPLNFVNNFADVSTELLDELREEQLKPAPDPELAAELLADLRQNLTKITQHGQRAGSIVRAMLAHSRTSTGERQPTDLNALADEYLRLAYHGLRAKDKSFNATLLPDLAPGLPLVPGVSADLGRVLLNLFTNAFYAVHQRQRMGAEPAYVPTVGVSTRAVAGYLEVRVYDNGPGIAADIKDKIFQPFFTTKPTGEGTGLGLSLAHDIIVQGHGGTLTAESVPGTGTTFTITLPGQAT